MRRFWVLLLLVSCIHGPALSETVKIEVSRDGTLIDDRGGALANGAGHALFVGRTSIAGARRALLHFDVGRVLPNEAVIESARLTLFMTPSNDPTRELSLHRVLADWGEGESFSFGGAGAASEPGDATWIHTFFDSGFWSQAGGDFVRRPSSSLDVGATGSYTWESTELMAKDVDLWNSVPRRNFGWILIGDESEPQTAKSFVSRENPEAPLRPLLEVTFRLRD